MIQYRPLCGAGSCDACRASLGLDAVKEGGVWYCGVDCAQGRPAAVGDDSARPKLYHRPRRFFGRRRPKELRSS